MAEIITTEYLNYLDGEGKDSYSSVVGFANNVNRCVRFKFKSPASGASHVAIKGMFSVGDGEAIKPRWYITTSDSSHANAGADAAYHGELSISLEGGAYPGTGEADVLLLPNTTYYLWLFPQDDTYGWWYHGKEFTITTTGAAGLVRIGDGSKYASHIAHIGNGSGYDKYIPYIGNGSGWDLYS